MSNSKIRKHLKLGYYEKSRKDMNIFIERIEIKLSRSNDKNQAKTANSMSPEIDT